jgi:hypothetical protein
LYFFSLKNKRQRVSVKGMNTLTTTVIYLLLGMLGLGAAPFLFGFLGFRTCLYAWFLVLVGAGNLAATEIHADYVCDLDCDRPPLNDRGFDLLPDSTNDTVLVVCVDSAPIVAFCVLLLGLYRDRYREGAGETRVKIIQTFVALFAMRFFVMQATALPPAKQGNASLPLTESFLTGLLPVGHNKKGHESHYDLLFSGHVSMFLLSVLWVLKLDGALDGRYSLIWLLFAAVVCCLVSAGLVALRMHYSADVLLGIIIAVLLFLNASR